MTLQLISLWCRQLCLWFKFCSCSWVLVLVLLYCCSFWLKAEMTSVLHVSPSTSEPLRISALPTWAGIQSEFFNLNFQNPTVAAHRCCTTSLCASPMVQHNQFPAVDPSEGLHQHLPAISCLSRAELSNARTLHIWGNRQMEKVSFHSGSSLDLWLLCTMLLIQPALIHWKELCKGTNNK